MREQQNPGLQRTGGTRQVAPSTTRTRCPGTPLGSMGDTDRGGIATDGVVHTLQKHEDKGTTTPTQIKCSEICSCACTEGRRAGASRSVLSWQRATAASNGAFTIHGPPWAMGQPPPHPGPAGAAPWATTGCNVVGPPTGTRTARWVPKLYANHATTGNLPLTDHTRTNYQHQRPTKTSTPTPVALRQARRQTSRPYGDWHRQATTTLLQ